MPKAVDRSNFVYPNCKVCSKPTPTLTKDGNVIDHKNRLTAKTCGDAACKAELMKARKKTLPAGEFPQFQPKKPSPMDEAIYAFTHPGKRAY